MSSKCSTCCSCTRSRCVMPKQILYRWPREGIYFVLVSGPEECGGNVSRALLNPAIVSTNGCSHLNAFPRCKLSRYLHCTCMNWILLVLAVLLKNGRINSTEFPRYHIRLWGFLYWQSFVYSLGLQNSNTSVAPARLVLSLQTTSTHYHIYTSTDWDR